MQPLCSHASDEGVTALGAIRITTTYFDIARLDSDSYQQVFMVSALLHALLIQRPTQKAREAYVKCSTAASLFRIF